MKRGEIYYANLDPAIGSETAKSRPVLIISNDINNRAANTVTVLPITSNVERVYPFEVFLQPTDSGLPLPSKVQAQQIRTISKQRITIALFMSLKYRVLSLRQEAGGRGQEGIL